MKVALITLLLLSSTLVFGQTAGSTESYSEDNIYYQALTHYLQYVKANENVTLDTIFVEDDFKFTDSLLLQSGNTKLIKLDTDNLRQVLKERKELILYRLFPLQYENGEFSVSFVPFSVARGKKKNSINYINPGSYSVIFKFDNNKFDFVRIDAYGL